MFGAGLLEQDAKSGKLMAACSPVGAMSSSVAQRARWTARSRFVRAATRRKSGRWPRYLEERERVGPAHFCTLAAVSTELRSDVPYDLLHQTGPPDGGTPFRAHT